MSNRDDAPHMWSYWRDKKGIEEALEDYYPDTLQENPQLQMALFQIRSAEAFIDQFMMKREEEHDPYK